jgi:hypothetical protein
MRIVEFCYCDDFNSKQAYSCLAESLIASHVHLHPYTFCTSRRIIKMKNKKYSTVGTIPRSNIKIDTSDTNTLSWFGTWISIQKWRG